MNKNLFPKYITKLLTLFLLVGGLVFLLSDKTLGVDFPQFDNCMISTHGQFDGCIYVSRGNHGLCNTNCAGDPNPALCRAGCDTAMTAAQGQCSLNYNSRIWTQPGNCSGISVPNYKQIEKRCRTESSRMYDKCVINTANAAVALGCMVNGTPDLDCCAQAEANNIQACLYP